MEKKIVKKEKKIIGKDIYVLDRLVHKPVKVSGVPKDLDIAPKTKLIYRDAEGKEMLGVVLGYKTDAEKKGEYVDILSEFELKRFEEGEEKAKELFEMFKKEFSKEFPTAVAITARMNLQCKQIYFYFFAESRFNFSEFVKIFRPKVGLHFFIYQVGPRDRVRLHPNLHEWYDPSGMPLMYHIFKHSLGNIHKNTLEAQQLGGRSQQRMKDRSGKLDHTINFEKEFYDTENKKYPARGSIVQWNGKPMKCIGYNLLSQEIKLRGKTPEEKQARRKKKDEKEAPTKRTARKDSTRFGEFITIHLDDYSKEKQTKSVS